jgi:hypothetical protein
LLAPAIALVLGGGAVVLQWMWAAPVTNGWYCTGRLACWLWTRANTPAYMVASIFDDDANSGESFVPIAVGVFLQWSAIGFALASLPAALKDLRR